MQRSRGFIEVESTASDGCRVLSADCAMGTAPLTTLKMY